MTPHEAETDARVYDGLGRAIRSVAPPDAAEDARVAAGVIVYRNNVRAAFLRTLRDTFPVVHRLVGEEFFRRLGHEYFHAHPPSQPLASRYGDSFPSFLASFEAASGLPYLPDTARLELAWLGAYHAAEAGLLETGEFLGLLTDDPGIVRVVLHPSVRLVKSQFPVHTIWLHNKSQRVDKLKLPTAGEHVVVKRPAHKVLTDTVSSSVFNTLMAISGGCRLGEALAIAMKDDSSATPAEIVQSIATMNIVTAVRGAA